MNNMDIKKEYTYDDVVILPKPSSIKSRDDVDISVTLYGQGGNFSFSLGFPLIAAPMKGIVDANFIVKLSELGGLGVLHRFYTTEEEHFAEIAKASKAKRFGISLGITDTLETYIKVLEYQPSILVVDVANGYTAELCKKCLLIKKHIEKISPNTLLVSGNVTTKDGVENLLNNGVDIVRVGVGNGAECSTTNITGIGRPIISAIDECSRISSMGSVICADGGIKNSGDFVKAIVAGADFGMAGALFAQTFESVNDGIIYGQASRKLQEMRGTQIKSIEGFERIVQKRVSLADFVKEFSYGIRSAGTYLNAHNLSEIRANGVFVEAGKNTIKENY